MGFVCACVALYYSDVNRDINVRFSILIKKVTQLFTSTNGKINVKAQLLLEKDLFYVLTRTDNGTSFLHFSVRFFCYPRGEILGREASAIQ